MLVDFLFATLYFLIVVWLILKRISAIRISCLVFVSSVFWTWVNLYQRSIAQKFAVVLKNPGGASDCYGEKTWKERLYNQLFTEEERECRKYQEAVLVNALWENSPLAAAGETIALLFFSPLEGIGSNLGKFCLKLFQSVNYLMQPVVFMFVMIFILSFIAMLLKYRIRLPFVTIEPVVSIVSNNRVNLNRSLGIQVDLSKVPIASDNALVSETTAVQVLPGELVDPNYSRGSFKYVKRNVSFLVRK